MPLFLLVGAELFSWAYQLVKKVDEGRSPHILSTWLALLFLVLPVISRVVCQSFRCETYDGGDNGDHSFLFVDSSLDCDSDRYGIMLIFALIMMLVYPVGAPLALFVLLLQHKQRLNPPGVEEDEAIKQRKEDAVLAEESITNFSMVYRPKYWFYEVYNTVRRLLLTSAVLVTRDLGETTLFIVCVGTVTLVIEQESKPHVNPFLSAFCQACCWQILLFILYLLLLDSDLTTEGQAVWISALLMVSNICLIVRIMTGVGARSELPMDPVSRATASAGGGIELTDFAVDNPLHSGGGGDAGDRGRSSNHEAQRQGRAFMDARKETHRDIDTFEFDSEEAGQAAVEVIEATEVQRTERDQRDFGSHEAAAVVEISGPSGSV